MTFSTIKLSLILFGLAQLLKLQAFRHAAFRARLKERDLVAQIMARDEETGRWFQFKDGQDHHRGRPASGSRHQADVQERGLGRQAADAAGQLAQPDQRPEGFHPRRRWPRRSDQLVRPDPDDEPDRGWQDRHAAGRRHHALLQHDQWRAGVRLRQGRQDRAHDADRFRRRRPEVLDHRGARHALHAATQDHAGAARAKREVDRLFARPAALSDEAGRLRSQWRAQSAEPRQIRLCAHLVGGSDLAGHHRDQAAEARAWARRHHVLARLASYLGQYRLLPLGAVPLRQCGRHDARASQPGFLGRLVLGRGASLGLHAAGRPVGNLRHRGGLPAELRHDRVLGRRSGIDLGLLRGAGRHRAEAVVEKCQARHQDRARRSLLQRVGAIPARQVARAAGPPPRSRWRWPSPMCGSRKASTTKTM